MKSRKSRYAVSAWIRVLTDCEVIATDFEDAARQAKTMRLSSWVELSGEHIDSDPVDIQSIHLSE